MLRIEDGSNTPGLHHPAERLNEGTAGPESSGYQLAEVRHDRLYLEYFFPADRNVLARGRKYDIQRSGDRHRKDCDGY